MKEKEWDDCWWENVFNQTANGIKAVEKGQVMAVNDTDLQKDNRAASNGVCGVFISERAISSTDHTTSKRPMTDEELFRACEGRTAHKGARSCMSGKLLRAHRIGLGFPEVEKYKDCDDNDYNINSGPSISSKNTSNKPLRSKIRPKEKKRQREDRKQKKESGKRRKKEMP